MKASQWGALLRKQPRGDSTEQALSCLNKPRTSRSFAGLNFTQGFANIPPS